jgi:NADH-quinone oxidoreductase subunit D
VFESIKIIRYLMEHLPSGDIVMKVPRKIPVGESISHTEAPRGEDIHYLRANGTERPNRYKVRTPTMANLPVIAEMLKGTFLADVPIVVAAIDPCMGCMDRVLLLKEGSEKQGDLIAWDRLRAYGIKWYAERGWKA